MVTWPHALRLQSPGEPVACANAPCTPAIPVSSQEKTGHGSLACSQTGWESDLPPSEGLPYLSPWGISSHCGFSHPSAYRGLLGVLTAELHRSPGVAHSLPSGLLWNLS